VLGGVCGKAIAKTLSERFAFDGCYVDGILGFLNSVIVGDHVSDLIRSGSHCHGGFLV
jgi:hypothetical protein